jgi:hypothetical protein
MSPFSLTEKLPIATTAVLNFIFTSSGPDLTILEDDLWKVELQGRTTVSAFGAFSCGRSRRIRYLTAAKELEVV